MEPTPKVTHADPGVVEPLHDVVVSASMFAVYAETLTYTTGDAPQFIDITEHVRAVVERSGVHFGQAAVFSAHTTAAVILNEHEPLLLNDMARVLHRVAPADDYYEHNDFSIRTVNMHPDEFENGHSHCQHLFLGTSETIPVHEGEIRLGHWQRCFLVELDRGRRRRVTVQVLGARLER
jgi:secondary thiamine-phosphate synthase enzyme